MCCVLDAGMRSLREMSGLQSSITHRLLARSDQGAGYVSTCRISVVSVNWRTSQKPKMAVTFWPGTMGFRSPPLRMLSAMISAPASPKPTAIRLRFSAGVCEVWLS